MYIIIQLLFFACFGCLIAMPSPNGKVDVGPVVMQIDMLESGKTCRELTLYGLKADASIIMQNGLAFRPSILLGSGDAELRSASLGVGFYYPATDTLSITPLLGISYTHFSSAFHFQKLIHCKEKINSYGPYLGLDVSWTFRKSWRLCANVQYVWSRVHTVIRPLLKDKNRSEGPSYGAALEYDLNSNWSLTLGGAYNSSLSKEKHGIRGKGLRLGISYWF